VQFLLLFFILFIYLMYISIWLWLVLRTSGLRHCGDHSYVFYPSDRQRALQLGHFIDVYCLSINYTRRRQSWRYFITAVFFLFSQKPMQLGLSNLT